MSTHFVKILHIKCEAKGCRNKVRRRPCDIKMGRNRFCSHKCARISRPLPKWGKSEIVWIKSHIRDLSYQEMADYFGVGLKTFTKALHDLRERGHKIPKLRQAVDSKPKPIGYQHRSLRANGQVRIIEKTLDGWKDVTSKHRVKGKTGPKEGKHPAVKRTPKNITVVPVPVETVAKTRIELPGKRFVVCDSDKVEQTIKYLLKQTA